jgi:uncharacterized membrane protein YcaP (DUF421 family)
MDAVIRAAVIYTVLYIVFRISGKRSLTELSAFDLLLLLIISEATQQAMVDSDNSMTHSILLVVTLVGIDILLSVIKQRSPTADRVLDSVPVILVEHGRPVDKHMQKERVSEGDILAHARLLHGISRLDDIAWAVLESSGEISIIPKEK